MKITERFHNVETGEIVDIERELTVDEIAHIEAIKSKKQQELTELEAKEMARKAILEKLGLTADEAAALLG